MDADSPPDIPPPATIARRRNSRRWLAAIIATAALLVLAAVALLAPYTATGTRVLLGLLPGLQISQPQGSLLGGDYSAERITYPLSATQTLVLTQPSWRGLQWHYVGGLRLSIERMHIARVELQGAPAASQPIVLPQSLVLPLAVHIGSLAIDRIDAPALGDRPLKQLQLALDLGRGSGASHRIDGLQLQWDRLQASASAQVQARAPLAVVAELALRPLAQTGDAGALPLAQDWQASLTARGPLAELQLQARLRARQQALDATATLRPAEAQPVRGLQASAQGFDLAGLNSAWPRTALTGQVDAQLDTAGQALQLMADLRNEAPGRYDNHALPLRSLKLTARSDLHTPQRGRIEALALQLAGTDGNAGRLTAQGTWDRPADALVLTLQARLDDVQPARLDARAPPLQLGGRIDLQLSQAAGGSATVRGDLQGRLLSRATMGTPANAPWQLRLDATAAPNEVVLRSLDTTAGAAHLGARGHARRGNTGWAVQLDADWQRFDPSLWWPGTSAAWQRGPHRLDGQLKADLQLPDAGVAPLNALALLARAQGQATLTLAPSVLAGMPLAGELALRQAAPGQGLGTQGRFTLGSGAQAGTLTLDGSFDPRGSTDRWALAWQLPDLATLQPLLQLTQPSAQLSGDSRGTLQLAGRWPALAGSGNLTSQRLRWQPGPSLTPSTGQAAAPGSVTELRDVSARFQAGSTPQDALQLDARLGRAWLGRLQLDQATLTAQGRGDAHQLQLRSGAQVNNPPGETNAGPPRHYRAELAAEGGWFRSAVPAARGAAPATGWGWQGRISQLALRDADAASPTAAASAASATAPLPIGALWLRADPTTLRYEQRGAVRELRIDPTRLMLGDATLAFDATRWQQSGDGAPTLAMRGRLEPFALAPLLARAQPGFGWRGDLRVAGRIDINASPAQFQADIGLQRESGDLVVQDPDNPVGPQSLGLTELRLALQAQGGQWRLSEQIAGTRLGRLVGEQRLSTPAQAWWPGAGAPLAGQVELQVAQLGHWGRWLPPGWRLSGELASQLRLGGRLGAPRLDGELTGRKIAVRNLLQGVDWHDAELRVLLAGDSARIETLRVLAGNGTLSASGSAQLGDKPQLVLKAQAEHFAVLQRVDRRVVVSGQAEATLDAQTTRVTARLQADEGRIDFSRSDAPALADDVTVQRPGEATAAASASNSNARPRSTVLDIRADLGPAFQLRGRGLATRLTGQLALTSPNNKPQLSGTIKAEDGTYAAYGQKLALRRGLITFTGALDNPRLDVLATRDDLDAVQVGVAISGTAQAPRVRLYSDPEMGDTDKLSWLLLGRASDGLGGTDLALLQRAAFAVISGESDSPGLIQRLGLDSLSVGQTDGTVRETVVSLGKQLSRRWYVGYERSLQATAGNWQVIYRLAQRFTLRAQSGAENALDVIWTWRWGE
ncbi:MAG: translocation/assembly module TamB domain-containing protein [Burkholderiales bacterium]